MYDKTRPTIIKFSEYGAKFMQLNMIAHDYAHDFNPCANIGKNRLKQSFDHVLNKTKYINNPLENQLGGYNVPKSRLPVAFRKSNKLQNKRTSKVVANKNMNRYTNKLNIVLKNIYAEKPLSPHLTASFSRKINILTSLSKQQFILYFYNPFLEDAIHVFVFELLGFINYSCRQIKNGNYLKYIKEGFELYQNNKKNYKDLSEYINPIIYKNMHKLFESYFDIIYNENRHVCYINILNDNILIQKLKIGFILLSNMSEKMLSKINLSTLIGYIDGIHVQLFTYLYYSDFGNVTSKQLLGVSSTFSNKFGISPLASSGEMLGGNQRMSYEDCIKAENRIAELKEYLKEELLSDDISKVKSGAKYLISELAKFFTISSTQEKNLELLYRITNPSTRYAEQKRDIILDSIFSYIATIFTLNCAVVIREKKEEEERLNRQEKKLKEEIEAEARGDFTTQMTHTGWNIVGIITKLMLIRNNICSNDGEFTPYYNNILNDKNEEIDKKFLKLQVNILHHISFAKGETTTYDLDDILKKNAIDILKNNPQFIKSKKEINSLINISNKKQILINNAVALFENKIQNVKTKTFCPLSSVLDAMPNCSPSTIVKNPETFERGVTHFIIMGENNEKYFNGIMEFINNNKANIHIRIENQKYDTLEYQDNIKISDANTLEAAPVFKNQAEYIIKCFSEIHHHIIKENNPTKTMIWDFFFNNKGPNNSHYYYPNELLKIGNRKSLGDVFQEINGVCKNGAYIDSTNNAEKYKAGKDIFPHFHKSGITPRIVLSNDRPSGVRIAFILANAHKDSINPVCAGGYSGSRGGSDQLLLSSNPLTPESIESFHSSQ